MNKFGLAALILGSTLISTQALAYTTHTFGGGSCQPVYPSDAASIHRNGWGVANTSSTTNIQVECPLNAQFSTTSAPNVVQIGINAYDRSTTSDIRCTFERTDSSSNIYWSGTISTSGYGSAVQQSWTSVTVSEANWWVARCTIPAYSASNGTSHLVSLWFISSD
jgi:hypothetical protein